MSTHRGPLVRAGSHRFTSTDQTENDPTSLQLMKDVLGNRLHLLNGMSSPKLCHPWWRSPRATTCAVHTALVPFETETFGIRLLWFSEIVSGCRILRSLPGPGTREFTLSRQQGLRVCMRYERWKC